MLKQERDTPHRGGILAYVRKLISWYGLANNALATIWVSVSTAMRHMLIEMLIQCLLSGKTVQMIATMAMNMPKDDDEHRTTLIVVPAALLLQV